ncbi:MAG TPA: hypothetical protein VF806_03555, partial [Anaerolineaceae bacterium]
MLPLLRFLIAHPDASTWQMRLLGSYWLTSASLPQKLVDFALQYLRGLDPAYWYFPNTVDLSRHVMPGYGHLLRWSLPFGLLGLGMALRHFREPAYRVLLAAVLAAPAGAALVQVGITRILVMVIPMAILTALGVSAALEWLCARVYLPRTALSLAVFGLLAGVNLYMVWDALSNGPLWYTNYGLTGMQYGARQVFNAIADYHKAYPDRRILLSPTWTNGTDVLARFFFPDPLPFELASPDGAFQQVQPIDNTVFIMVPDEFARIPRTRFAEIRVEQTLLYPNGQPGFYFVQLKYVPNIAQVIAAEEARRHQPLTDTLVLGGQPVRVSYPQLDIGQIQDIFSRDPAALIRSAAINPMQLTFDFSTPRHIRGIMMRVGGMAMDITVQVGMAGKSVPLLQEKHLSEVTEMREVTFDFPSTLAANRLVVVIENTNEPPEGNVHLWHVEFK